MKHQRHLIPLVQDLHQLLMQVFCFTNVECRRIKKYLCKLCNLMRNYLIGDSGPLIRSVDYPRSHRSKQTKFDKTFFLRPKKR